MHQQQFYEKFSTIHYWHRFHHFFQPDWDPVITAVGRTIIKKK